MRPRTGSGAPAPAAAPLLQVQALSLVVGQRLLWQDLSLQVQPGQRWAVIGRNAAGKSTLLRALAGLSVPGQAGQIKLWGDAHVLYDPVRAASLRAWLAQTPSDRFELTVAQWLDLHRSDAPVRTGGAAHWQALAQALDIAHLLQRLITRLSGGERQRVGLAAVAAQSAALWLLDEPVSFQDPAHQRLVSQWLQQQTQHAIVMSAHDMAWVQHTATHVLAVQAGGRWAAGPVQQVLSADVLQSTFGCEWHQVGGMWMTN